MARQWRFWLSFCGMAIMATAACSVFSGPPAAATPSIPTEIGVKPTAVRTGSAVLPAPSPADTAAPLTATAIPPVEATHTATGTPLPAAAGTQEQPATRTPLPLVPASSTPLPLSPTPTSVEAPFILSFQANVEEAAPGDTITLSWSTTNAQTVTLWHLMPTGQLGQFWPVGASGTFNYAIDAGERNSTTFALAASDGIQPAEMATVSVRLRCPDAWFFANAPDICPAQAAEVSGGAEQHFEKGLMLWVEAEDRIYALFADGSRRDWAAYQDDWDPGEPDRDPSLTPPPGLIQPVRGFGLVWREQPGLRERLGWAVDEEMAYPTALQRTSYAKYNHTYIRALDGNIWHLFAERSGWDKIPAG